MVKIDVVNETTPASGLSTEEVIQATQAFQTQVHFDFAPVWGIDAMVRVAAREDVHPAHEVIVLLDDSDQAGALGYHQETKNGRPMSLVFVHTTKAAGLLWTVTFTHEGLEMLADPMINLLVLDQAARRAYAYENCDAVEGDQFSYPRNGIQVSNFVFPRYFDQTQEGGAFDFQAKLTVPLPAMLPDGYLAYYDFSTGTWNQSTSRPGTSRGLRRQLPKHLWRRSTAV